MAIQMRRGLRADFDPYKMLPGEWAVSIDPSTSNQIVWMCFEPGVCKRMGTYEDFAEQVKEATADVKTEYVEEFDKILDEIKVLSSQVSDDKDAVVSIKTTIEDEYLPQIQEALLEIQEKVSEAKNSADAAAFSAENAKKSEVNAKNSETEAKTSETNAATSESNAKISETNAATSATTATTKATDAANYASSAETSALTATSKATTATQSATKAAQAATQAQTSAEAATISEQNAKTSEENAKKYAENVSDRMSDIALNKQTLGYNKKNLFKVGTVTSTSSGITYTVNADKSITANGTATADSGKSLGTFIPTPNMEYIFTANEKVPTDGLWNNACYIKGIDASDVWFGDSTGKNFIPKTNNPITCHIYIKKGTTVNNLTFYPMIRSADITDAAYEPYVDDVDKRLKDVETELGEIPNTYIPKKSILNSQEEIEANTESGKIADALVIKEVFQSVSSGKSLLAAAITDKGVDTAATATFQNMADNIANIETGGIEIVTATKSVGTFTLSAYGQYSKRIDFSGEMSNVLGIKNIKYLPTSDSTTNGIIVRDVTYAINAVTVTFQNWSSSTVNVTPAITVVGHK